MKPSSILLALHGQHFSGKDTLAIGLKFEFNFTRLAFADALYREVAESFGVKEFELRSEEWKTQEQNLLSIACSDCPKYRAMLHARGENMIVPRTSRFHLRNWAHEYRRSIDPFYWIREFQSHAYEVEGNLAVTDLRYMDEYHFLKAFATYTKRELVVAKVLRGPDKPPDNHASELGIPDIFTNIAVRNISGFPQVAIDALSEYLRDLQVPTNEQATG
jgi:hypothetical protein